MVQSDRPKMTVYHGSCACNAGQLRQDTDTQSEYLSFTAFPLQK